MIPALFALSAMAGLVIAGLRILHRQELQQQLEQARWQAAYSQKETEMTLTVSHAVCNNMAARVAKVYGNDYVDFLIARQMNLPDLEEPEADDSSRPFEVTYGGKGRNITGDSVQEYMAQREREEAYLQQQYMQSGYVPPTPPQYEPQYDPHHFRQESFHRPPTQWQAQPQAPCLAFRQNQMLPHWFNDDDIVDVTPVVPPVYPVALRPTDSMVLPTRCLPPASAVPTGAGRSRKYTNNAERQRAYRERRRQQLL